MKVQNMCDNKKEEKMSDFEKEIRNQQKRLEEIYDKMINPKYSV